MPRRDSYVLGHVTVTAERHHRPVVHGYTQNVSRVLHRRVLKRLSQRGGIHLPDTVRARAGSGEYRPFDALCWVEYPIWGHADEYRVARVLGDAGNWSMNPW